MEKIKFMDTQSGGTGFAISIAENPHPKYTSPAKITRGECNG